jgi:carbon-monoxide dehydrogenase iron sulfur subunit
VHARRGDDHGGGLSTYKTLITDLNRCTGCRSCELWCSFHHFKECNPSMARLRLVIFERRGLSIPVICRQCKDAPCMSECPVDAMMRDPVTNAVVIDNDLCIGCRACVDVCPFGVMKVAPTGDVFKCDLCGGDPICVKVCTRGALRYVNPTRASTDKSVAYARSLAESVAEKTGELE